MLRMLLDWTCNLFVLMISLLSAWSYMVQEHWWLHNELLVTFGVGRTSKKMGVKSPKTNEDKQFSRQNERWTRMTHMLDLQRWWFIPIKKIKDRDKKRNKSDQIKMGDTSVAVSLILSHRHCEIRNKIWLTHATVKLTFSQAARPSEMKRDVKKNIETCTCPHKSPGLWQELEDYPDVKNESYMFAISETGHEVSHIQTVSGYTSARQS